MTVSALGLALAFGASLCWSGVDVSRKLLSPRMGTIPLVVVLSLGQGPIFIGWALATHRPVDLAGYALPGASALVLNVLANVLFVSAVRISPLSRTVPLLALTPVFSTLIAMPLLGQHPSPAQWGGIAMVVAGALLLAAGPGSGFWSAVTHERGSLMMIGVAGIWSLVVSLDRLALEHAPVAVHALVQTFGVGLSLVSYLAIRGRLAELRNLRRAGPGALLMVACAAGAMGLQLLAIQQILVGLVETVKRAVGMVMSVALGRALFAEPVTAPKVAAVGLMAAGTALLVLS